MPRLTLRTLGGLQVHIDGESVDDFGSRKTCALLVYLAVESDRVHQRTHLAGLLWPDWPEQSARTYLRQSLAKLRDILGERAAASPCLSATRQTIQFNPASDYWLDTAELTSCLSAATGPHRQAMTPDLAGHLEDALAVYGGEFLEGFYLDACPEFGEWQLLTAEHVRRQTIEALDRLARWHGRRQDFAAALPHARRRVELEPYSEEGQRRYLRLLAQTGEGSAALAVYAEYRKLLLDTLQTEPAAATTALAESIRRGEVGSTSGEAGALPGDSLPPFLQPTVARVQPPFVARERELDRLSDHLHEIVSESRSGRVVFITGAAGQGKTALIHEFARRASDAHSNLLTVVGHGASRGGIGDPLSPFCEILSQLLGDLHAPLTAGILDKTQAHRLWSAFPDTAALVLKDAPQVAGTLAPLARVRRHIKTLPAAIAQPLLASLPAENAQAHIPLRQHSLFEEYTGILLAIARTHPLLILLDDLHWADRDSLSLLFHLGHRLEGSRILVLGAFRTEEVLATAQDSPLPFQLVYYELQRRGHAPIDLDAVDGRAFVDAYLDREPNCLDTVFRNTLYSFTSGSPLFTEELVHSMQDRGDLVRDVAGAWNAAPSISWQDLPVQRRGRHR